MAVDADATAVDSGEGRRGDGRDSAGLAQWLSEFALELQAEPGKDQIMQAVVRAAVDRVPGAQYAGITLVSVQGEVTTPVKTDDLVARIDELQHETGQGPCLSTA